jgi:TonB family protein
MSLSEICVQQHQREQGRLKRLLMWALLGSLGVHGIALGLSRFRLWPDPPEQLEPIELIVAEPVARPRPEPTEPAQLATQTRDPAAAPASAPAAAAVMAPSTREAPPLAPEALDAPQPADDGDAAAAEPSPMPSESLRDLLQRLRESRPGPAGRSDAASSPSTTTGGGSVPNAAPRGLGPRQGARTVACLNCVRPSYPQSALAAGVEGQPKVSVEINPDGSVRSVTLTRSSGNAAIDRAAVQAARRSRFQPVAGGASVPIEYDLSIEGSRRNQAARRRGERQAVDLPSAPAATTESAGPPAAVAPATPATSATPAPSRPPSAVPEPAVPEQAVPEQAVPAPPGPEPAAVPAPSPAPTAAPEPPAASAEP